MKDVGRIVGYFAFLPSPEPTYSKIYDGEWLDDAQSYHVVHRITSERGKGYGRQMMHHAIEAAKKHFGTKQIDIEAQEYAKGFYESVGFKQSSDTFMLDGIPHIRMTLKIEQFDDRDADIYAMDAEKKKINGMDLM